MLRTLQKISPARSEQSTYETMIHFLNYDPYAEVGQLFYSTYEHLFLFGYCRSGSHFPEFILFALPVPLDTC